jgi:GNAT superfamily N-acetyltransferase
VLLARDGGLAAGLASYSFLWPAPGLTQSLFLKELYVRQAYRGHGVGRLLMQRVFEIAAETGCSRVEWMTEQTNNEAKGVLRQARARAEHGEGVLSGEA